MPFTTTFVRTSVRNRSVTSGLTGVTNGSPKLGRSKAVVRLIQGTQRYRLVMPLARVNSQASPPVVDRSVARNGTTTVVLDPAGRTPPRGTVTVCPPRDGVTAMPSTVTVPSASPPSGPITVFSRRRSTPAPESLRAVMVTEPRSTRAATASRASTAYVAVMRIELRFTLPATIAVPVAATGSMATCAAVSGRSMGATASAAGGGERREEHRRGEQREDAVEEPPGGRCLHGA